jgi:hypothetical protein
MIYSLRFIGFLGGAMTLSAFLLVGCIPQNYPDFALNCAEDAPVLTSWSELAALAGDGVVAVRDSLWVEGIVVSSDREGQYFGEVILQPTQRQAAFNAAAQNVSTQRLAGPYAAPPSQAWVLQVEGFSLFQRYPPGSIWRLQLKDLSLEVKRGILQVGSTWPVFGHPALGRLPLGVLSTKMQRICTDESPPLVHTHLGALDTLTLGSWVVLDSVALTPEWREIPLAMEGVDSFRTLVDCQERTAEVWTSGYADFRDSVPAQMGSMRALWWVRDQKKALVMERYSDWTQDQVPCPQVPNTLVTDAVFISELADPVNDIKGRFIELYNHSDVVVPLRDWSLVRFTNEATTPSHTLRFTTQRIQPHSTLVIGVDEAGFAALYGRAPDLMASTSSAAGSNGDDNTVLLGPTGAVVDVFGVPGVDGTGTASDYEDGRAIRRAHITRGHPQFDPSQWRVFNRRGGSGTTQQTQMAPGDFSPFVHEVD